VPQEVHIVTGRLDHSDDVLHLAVEGVVTVRVAAALAPAAVHREHLEALL
jgi:hypothetical protein